MAILSNRPESELAKELNAMGVAHYFDVTSGKPTLLLEENGERTLKSKKYNKPNPDRLNEIIAQQHNLDDANWNFWGDTDKDITQVRPLIREGKLSAHKVKGYLINPNAKIGQKVKKELQGVEIVSAKSLVDLPTIDNY